MSDKRSRQAPKATGGDLAHTIAKAGMSAIPVVGGPAAELFAALVIPPLTRRRDEWMQSIAEGVQQLERQVEGFEIGALSENEAFITAVAHATQIALRNHQDEKREALRNAVLNVAIGRAPNEDLQLMFLQLIDTLTVWHLRILAFFENPRAYGTARGVKYPDWGAGGLGTILEHTFPELRGQRTFYDQVGKDLFTRGLFSTESLHAMMTGSGMFSKRTTEMGDVFLAFVTSPVEVSK